VTHCRKGDYQSQWKTPDFGHLQPPNPESIDLNFDLDDYVGGVTLCAKNGTNRPSKAEEAKG